MFNIQNIKQKKIRSFFSHNILYHDALYIFYIYTPVYDIFYSATVGKIYYDTADNEMCYYAFKTHRIVHKTNSTIHKSNCTIQETLSTSTKK